MIKWWQRLAERVEGYWVLFRHGRAELAVMHGELDAVALIAGLAPTEDRETWIADALEVSVERAGRTPFQRVEWLEALVWSATAYVSPSDVANVLDRLDPHTLWDGPSAEALVCEAAYQKNTEFREAFNAARWA